MQSEPCISLGPLPEGNITSSLKNLKLSGRIAPGEEGRGCAVLPCARTRILLLLQTSHLSFEPMMAVRLAGCAPIGCSWRQRVRCLPLCSVNLARAPLRRLSFGMSLWTESGARLPLDGSFGIGSRNVSAGQHRMIVDYAHGEQLHCTTENVCQLLRTLDRQVMLLASANVAPHRLRRHNVPVVLALLPQVPGRSAAGVAGGLTDPVHGPGYRGIHADRQGVQPRPAPVQRARLLGSEHCRAQGHDRPRRVGDPGHPPPRQHPCSARAG